MSAPDSTIRSVFAFGSTYSANSRGTPSSSSRFFARHAFCIASWYTASACAFAAMSRGTT